MYFLVNAYPKPLDVAISDRRCIGHMMWSVLGNILCKHDPKVNVKSAKRVCAMVYYRLQFSLLNILM